MDITGAIISADNLILVTGASGFMGPRVVESLVNHGFRNVRCFARPSGNLDRLEAVIHRFRDAVRIEVVKGNLLSPEDCARATQGVAVIYHLAAARGEKSVPEAFMNSVVTTRNLVEAALHGKSLKRFVNLSSFSVYTNRDGHEVLDETCAVERQPESRGDAYSFAKVKQDELVSDYGQKHGLPYVIVRPGVVYGPGNEAIHGRVGIRTFGLFLHLGGNNALPLTYVDNCAEAIVLAGVKAGVEGEVFNVVDDEPMSSGRFLKEYKRRVKNFRSLYLPHFASYLLCWLWEKYSEWSEGQLPPLYNRKVWHVYWKRTRHTNEKIKRRLGWQPKVPATEALARHLEHCRGKEQRA